MNNTLSARSKLKYLRGCLDEIEAEKRHILCEKNLLMEELRQAKIVARQVKNENKTLKKRIHTLENWM